MSMWSPPPGPAIRASKWTRRPRPTSPSGAPLPWRRAITSRSRSPCRRPAPPPTICAVRSPGLSPRCAPVPPIRPTLIPPRSELVRGRLCAAPRQRDGWGGAFTCYWRPSATRRWLSSRLDRGAALLVVAMNLDRAPYAVDVVRVAAGEGVNSSAVRGVDDEDRPDRCLAVVGDQRAGGHHVDIVVAGLVEMNAMRAVELRARRQNIPLVDGVDDEQHREPARVRTRTAL